MKPVKHRRVLRLGNSSGIFAYVVEDSGHLAVAFGQRVRAARMKRNLPQSEVARMMTEAGFPVHQTTLAKIEAGTRPTPVPEVHALAAVLGVRPSELLGDPTSDLPADLADASMVCDLFQQSTLALMDAERRASDLRAATLKNEHVLEQLRSERNRLHHLLLDYMELPRTRDLVRSVLMGLLGPDGLHPPVDEKAGR